MSEPVRRCLVGYGNPLRGDDGAAWELAARVRGGDWTVLTAVQLLPELSQDLQSYDLVVFADACLCSGPPRRSWLEPLSLDCWPVHCGRPEQLLELCRQLYGRAPQAWMLSLPGESFDYRLGLSPRARESVGLALQLLQTWPVEPTAFG